MTLEQIEKAANELPNVYQVVRHPQSVQVWHNTWSIGYGAYCDAGSVHILPVDAEEKLQMIRERAR